MVNSEIDKYLKLVTFTPAVVGYLRVGDRICLGERKQVSSNLGEGLIAGIGGKVGDSPEIENESSEEAFDREVLEEIGVRVLKRRDLGRVRFVFAHKPPDSKWNQDVRIYAVDEWEGEPKETETTRPLWFKIEEIPWKRMWEDNAAWLPKVLVGESVNASFLYSGDNTVSEYRFS